MRTKTALAAVTAIGAAMIVFAYLAPAGAMGPVGPAASSKADNNTLVEKVHRRWRRGYAYYPRARWYGYRYRPYYYSGYYEPYYYAPRYYRPYYRPYYSGYYGYGYPRYYGGGVGIYGPRFGLRIGF